MSRGIFALEKNDQRAVREWLRLKELAESVVGDDDRHPWPPWWVVFAFGMIIGILIGRF